MEKVIEEFKKLLDTSATLFGPEGCSWDREQTLVSMRGSILEEACEVIEAIDAEDDENLKEELGDLLYNVIFFCTIAEKDGRFTFEEALRLIREKLVARHPHVFGDKKLDSTQKIIDQWEEIKKKEKHTRESLLDGIPKALPALARAFKMAGKMKKTSPKHPDFEDEEALGELLWEISCQARQKGLNPENALRKSLLVHETTFREAEKS